MPDPLPVAEPATHPLSVYGPRAARVAAGLSREVVAKRARLSEDYVRKIEAAWEKRAAGAKGAILAPYHTACRIAYALRSDVYPTGAPVDLFYRFPVGTMLTKPQPTARLRSVERPKPPTGNGLQIRSRFLPHQEAF